jgi:hypothetical protein
MNDDMQRKQPVRNKVAGHDSMGAFTGAAFDTFNIELFTYKLNFNQIYDMPQV